jgi:hypothetical protein
LYAAKVNTVCAATFANPTKRGLAQTGLHPKKWTSTFGVFTIANGGVRCKGFRRGGTRLSSGPRP